MQAAATVGTSLMRSRKWLRWRDLKHVVIVTRYYLVEDGLNATWPVTRRVSHHSCRTSFSGKRIWQNIDEVKQQQNQISFNLTVNTWKFDCCFLYMAPSLKYWSDVTASLCASVAQKGTGKHAEQTELRNARNFSSNDINVKMFLRSASACSHLLTYRAMARQVYNATY